MLFGLFAGCALGRCVTIIIHLARLQRLGGRARGESPRRGTAQPDPYGPCHLDSKVIYTGDPFRSAKPLPPPAAAPARTEAAPAAETAPEAPMTGGEATLEAVASLRAPLQQDLEVMGACPRASLLSQAVLQSLL